MKIENREVSGITIVDLIGDLKGGSDAVKFHESISKLVKAGKKNIIVNVGKVGTINSSGIGALMSAYTSAKNAGGSLKILNPTEKIKSLLTITKLITIFETFNSEEEAVKSFS